MSNNNSCYYFHRIFELKDIYRTDMACRQVTDYATCEAGVEHGTEKRGNILTEWGNNII